MNRNLHSTESTLLELFVWLLNNNNNNGQITLLHRRRSSICEESSWTADPEQRSAETWTQGIQWYRHKTIQLLWLASLHSSKLKNLTHTDRSLSPFGIVINIIPQCYHVQFLINKSQLKKNSMLSLNNNQGHQINQFFMRWLLTHIYTYICTYTNV